MKPPEPPPSQPLGVRYEEPRSWLGRNWDAVVLLLFSGGGILLCLLLWLVGIAQRGGV